MPLERRLRRSSSRDDERPRRREKYRRERSIVTGHSERSPQRRQGDQDERLQRLELMVETMLQEQRREKSLEASSVEPRTIKYITRTDCVPEFVPGNPNMTITRWIFKIDQLGEVHRWDDVEKIYHMQNGLRGLAKTWYDSLSNINYSWDEWKKLLQKAFPEHSDYAASLRKLIERTKKSNETMATYYYNKLELLQICKITGRDAVSCIIDGLGTTTLQNGARAGRYEIPERLYEEYLSQITEDEAGSDRQNKNSKRRNDEQTSNENTTHINKIRREERPQNSRHQKVRCFNCSATGHIATKCPKPRKSCENCKLLGHVSSECKRKKTVCTLESQKTNKVYFVDCKINNIPTRGYIDTGSAAVTINEQLVSDLNLDLVSPSKITINGFGGGSITVIGKTSVTLDVNDVSVEVEVLVVPDKLQQIPVLIGQPFINHPKVAMLIQEDRIHIMSSCSAALPQVCKELLCKTTAWAAEATVIPPGFVGFISIKTTPEDVEEIYVESTTRRYENAYYYFPRCIVRRDGIIPVTNMGQTELVFKEGQVVFRGEKCCEDTYQGNVNILTTQANIFQPFRLSDINIPTDAPDEIKQKLLKLLNKYRDCFAQNLRELGKTDLVEMEIELKDEKPVVYRPYRLSHPEREKVRGLVDNLLENGIIRDSHSPFASPILLVKKRTGGERLCVDYRGLNKQTIKNKYPLPRVEDQLDNLCGSSYFTSLDMASGYYQIPMKENSIAKTAFITPDGHFEYLRMPFGLVNAPAVFQNLVNQVLGPSRFTTALPYMDDILVPSVDYDDGFDNLQNVLCLLRKANLTLQLSKCYFFQTHVNYLGHEISKEGIRPGSAKILAVQNFKEPQNVREVRQFLGLTSYFRKFIKNFALIAKPLTNLTRKDMNFVWGSEQKKAFDELKRKLSERPLLALYDVKAETELHTDACKMGIAGILMQLQQNGKWQPVAYFSRQTTREEQRYHSYELETLAVVQSLKRFRVYLIGKPFRVVTDCNALRTTLTKRDLLPRVGRWWLTVQEFDFTVVYRPGSKMAHVDALSRNPVEQNLSLDEIDILNINLNEDDWVLTAQLQDTRIAYLHEVLSQEPKTREEKDIHEKFQLKNNRVFRKTDEGLRWVVPKTARRLLTMINHDQKGHFSHEKTLSLMQKTYWFPAMRQYVKRYISTCLGCLYNKEPAGRRPGYLHPIEKIGTPLHTIHIDHLGPFVQSKKKNAYLIVAVDAFTKYVFMKAVPNTKEIHVEKFLNEKIIAIFGVPKRIICDKGTCYTSKKFREFCERLGIKVVFNATATPRANGQVERYNKTILASLASTSSDEERWDNEVTKVNWGLNVTMNKATGKSPFELLFGYTPRSVDDAFLATEIDTDQYDTNVATTRADVKERLQENQQREKLRYDRKRCDSKKFREGQLVLIKKVRTGNEVGSKKLLPKYDGPFLVQRILPNDRFVVCDPQGATRSRKSYKGIVAIDKLKPYEVVQEDTSDAASTSSTEAGD